MLFKSNCLRNLCSNYLKGRRKAKAILKENKFERPDFKADKVLVIMTLWLLV